MIFDNDVMALLGPVSDLHRWFAAECLVRGICARTEIQVWKGSSAKLCISDVAPFLFEGGFALVCLSPFRAQSCFAGVTEVRCWWVHSACKELCSGQHSCYHSTAWLPPHNSPLSSISHLLTTAASELLPKCRTKLLLAKDPSIALEQQTLLCHTSCCLLRLGSLSARSFGLGGNLWQHQKHLCPALHAQSILSIAPVNTQAQWSVAVPITPPLLHDSKRIRKMSVDVRWLPLAASTAMKPTMFRWHLWKNYWIFNNDDKIESR